MTPASEWNALSLREENKRLMELLKDTAWELDCVLEALNEATPEELYAVTKSAGMSALVVARAALRAPQPDTGKEGGQ